MKGVFMRRILIAICISVIYILYSRPFIRETDSGTQMHIDGTWIVKYEYSLNGVPYVVFLPDDTALREYRAYLKRIGWFHKGSLWTLTTVAP